MSELTHELPSHPNESPAAVPNSTAAEVALLAALADDFAERVRRQERPAVEEYAAKHPERVSRLTLEMPFVRGAEALDSEIGRAVRALRSQDWELYTEASMYLIANRNREWAERSAALLRAAATPEMARRTWAAVDAFDVSKQLGAVRCPTLVTSRKDWLLRAPAP